MTTQEIICDLRDQAEVFGPCTIYHLLNTAADELEDLDKRVRRWVSVKERLPEESGNVLVHCEDGYMAIVNYSAKHQQFCNYDICAKRSEEWDVTHWMPLPALPEEVSHEP